MKTPFKLVQLDASRLDSYCRLLSTYAYKPYHYYSFHDQKLTDYFQQEISAAIQDSGNAFLGLERNGRAVGAVLCATRPWETEVLGVGAGAIGPVVVDEFDANAGEIRSALLDAAISWQRQNEVRHLSVRINMNDLSLLYLLEQSGFIVVDATQLFSLNLGRRAKPGFSSQSSESECRLHQESDVPDLRRIAECAYSHDRFHSDPAVDSGVADRAFGRWIENSCRGLDDAVVVATSQQMPVGFMSLRINRLSRSMFGTTVGKIWLVGVDKEARGQGFGRSLMRHSLDWFANHNVDLVEVGTQVRNTVAMGFYIRSGFAPANPLLALRKIV